MSEHTPTLKLVMGHIEIVANGKTSVPDDDAVIHIDGDEDSEIEVHCPDALRLAAFIVKAVNAHDRLVAAAQKVLDGLNARIDHACSVKAPVPVFDGIADLHSALASIKERA